MESISPLSIEEILNIVDSVATSDNIEKPSDWRQTCQNLWHENNLPASLIKNSDLKEVCEAVEGCSLEHAIVDFIKKVQKESRTQILLAMNPERKKLLLEFLDSLATGVTWNSNKLREWTSSAGKKGNTLWRWIYRQLSKKPEEGMRILLGDSAAKYLDRNPYSSQRNEFNQDELTDKESMSEFLQSLDAGQEWSISEFRKWYSLNKSEKKTLIFKGQKPNTYIRELLTISQLERNPIRSKFDAMVFEAKQTILAYLNTLEPGTSWSTQSLRNSIDTNSEDAFMTSAEFSELYTGDKIGGPRSSKIEKILGKNADILEKYPCDLPRNKSQVGTGVEQTYLQRKLGRMQ